MRLIWEMLYLADGPISSLRFYVCASYKCGEIVDLEVSLWMLLARTEPAADGKMTEPVNVTFAYKGSTEILQPASVDYGRFNNFKEGLEQRSEAFVHSRFAEGGLCRCPLRRAQAAALLPKRQGMRILEPSAGLGRLLDAIHNFEPSEVVAVEMAAECAREIFTQERAGVKLIQRDFLTITPEEIGSFDAVIMNPPFTMRSDIRHVLRALQFLRPNGTLAALVMDTSHREKALRHLSTTWEKIPAGAFKSEGTNVPTVMLSITR